MPTLVPDTQFPTIWVPDMPWVDLCCSLPHYQLNLFIASVAFVAVVRYATPTAARLPHPPFTPTPLRAPHTHYPRVYTLPLLRLLVVYARLYVAYIPTFCLHTIHTLRAHRLLATHYHATAPGAPHTAPTHADTHGTFSAPAPTLPRHAPHRTACPGAGHFAVPWLPSPTHIYTRTPQLPGITMAPPLPLPHILFTFHLLVTMFACLPAHCLVLHSCRAATTTHLPWFCTCLIPGRRPLVAHLCMGRYLYHAG